MKKKSYLLLCLITALFLVSGLTLAEDPVVLKGGHVLPKGHPMDTALRNWADLVYEKTDGSIVIEVYASAQLGGEISTVENAQMGVIDWSAIGAGSSAEFYPPLAVFDAPYIWRDMDHIKAVMQSDFIDQLSEETMDQMNMFLVGTWFVGTRHLTTSNTPVRKPQDVEGLLIRTPESEGYMDPIRAMGGKATPLAFSELYMALSQGVVDGQENPPAQIKQMKFYEVQNYLVLTGHMRQHIAILLNGDVWNGLTASQQTAVKESALEAGLALADELAESEPVLIEELDSLGMEVIEPEIELFREKAKKYIQEKRLNKFGKENLEKIEAIGK